jgi:hypothetical protein
MYVQNLLKFFKYLAGDQPFKQLADILLKVARDWLDCHDNVVPTDVSLNVFSWFSRPLYNTSF